MANSLIPNDEADWLMYSQWKRCLDEPVPTHPSGEKAADRPVRSPTACVHDARRFVGQEHLISPGSRLRTQIERDDTGSLIFWDHLARARLLWPRSSPT